MKYKEIRCQKSDFRSQIIYYLSSVLCLLFSVSDSSAISEQSWRLEQGQEWKPVSKQSQDRYLLSVAQIKKLVDTSRCRDAKQAFGQLKRDFPEIAGADSNDLEIYIEAELLRCKGKFTKAVRKYEKLLTDPNSELYEAALYGEFSIAKAFLAGRKKTVLGVFKIKGYAEGVRIMERISDKLAPQDATIAMDASVEVAKNYEERGSIDKENYDLAYIKWSDIFETYADKPRTSSSWPTGEIGKDALLAMARCKQAMFNGPEYDMSDLVGRPFNPVSYSNSAKGRYKQFGAEYPEDAKKFKIDKILKEIDEQVALKRLKIGQYYQKTGSNEPANLYYQMVIDEWPETEAARMAKQELKSEK